jgi:hypothetical protein
VKEILALLLRHGIMRHPNDWKQLGVEFPAQLVRSSLPHQATRIKRATSKSCKLLGKETVQECAVQGVRLPEKPGRSRMEQTMGLLQQTKRSQQACETEQLDRRCACKSSCPLPHRRHSSCPCTPKTARDLSRGRVPDREKRGEQGLELQVASFDTLLRIGGQPLLSC